MTKGSLEQLKLYDRQYNYSRTKLEARARRGESSLKLGGRPTHGAPMLVSGSSINPATAHSGYSKRFTFPGHIVNFTTIVMDSMTQVMG